MDIWEESKLLLFVAFVVPGFIAIKVYDLITPSKHLESAKQVIDAVSYSCINYMILLWPIYLVETSSLKTNHPNLYVFFYVVVLFFFPIILVLGWRYFRGLQFVQRVVPHPTQKPWDFVFSQGKTYWVIVTLKNGEKIAGMYGRGSFSSSAPSEEQLYLEQQWLLNDEGGFDRPACQTAGIIILSSEIRSVEFMHSGDAQNEQ